MNEFWNLDPMYKGFDDPAFEADLTAAKAKLDTFEVLMAQLSAMDNVLAQPTPNTTVFSAGTAT